MEVYPGRQLLGMAATTTVAFTYDLSKILESLEWDDDFDRLLQDENVTDAPTTLEDENVTLAPTLPEDVNDTEAPTSPEDEIVTVSPTGQPTVTQTTPPLSQGNNGDNLILVMGILGFIFFFGVVGFFVVNRFNKGNTTMRDTTGGRPLAAENDTVPMIRAGVSPLQSAEAGDRGSMSTIFSTDSHMSINSGYYNGKIEAEDGKDNNLMNLLKGKRKEHNKRKGNKPRPQPSGELGLSAANSMQELDAA